MHSGKISFRAASTGPELLLILRFDNQEIYQIKDLGPDLREICHEFDDSEEKEHLIEFEMQGKKHCHTVLDENGNITLDRVIKITDIALDDILLAHVFTEVAEYHHDRNGTSDPMIEKFYDTMGCNGVVKFRFRTPLYLWLLETI